MKIQVLVNPAAGHGRGKPLFSSLIEKLRDIGHDVEAELPSSRAEALAIAFQARQRGADLLLACGGDGTVHTLLPALANATMALGLIPAGTANDLARNWRIPLDPAAALDLLPRGKIREVDLLATGSGGYIAGAAGVGFDAAVVARAIRLRGRFQGFLPFVLAAFMEFMTYRPPRIALHAGGFEYRGPVWQLVATKIPRYAYFLKIGSLHNLKEGAMRIFLVPAVPRISLMLFFPLLPLLGFPAIPRARILDASALTVESSPPVPFHGDGDLMGQTPVTLRVVPKALRVLLPP